MDKESDNRNYDVTNKVFQVLNDTKGFDVAMSNPRKGVVIVRYNGNTFFLKIDPVFEDTDAGKEGEKESFENVVEALALVFE